MLMIMGPYHAVFRWGLVKRRRMGGGGEGGGGVCSTMKMYLFIYLTTHS